MLCCVPGTQLADTFACSCEAIVPVCFGAGASVAPAYSVALARCGAPASAAGASMQGHAARWGVCWRGCPAVCIALCCAFVFVCWVPAVHVWFAVLTVIMLYSGWCLGRYGR